MFIVTVLTIMMQKTLEVIWLNVCGVRARVCVRAYVRVCVCGGKDVYGRDDTNLHMYLCI